MKKYENLERAKPTSRARKHLRRSFRRRAKLEAQQWKYSF